MRRVKRSESALIQDPFTLPPTATLADARQLLRQHHIGGIPVVAADRRLVGILTSRDLRFEKDFSAPVTTVLVPLDRLVTAPAGIDQQAAEQMLQDRKVDNCPSWTPTAASPAC